MIRPLYIFFPRLARSLWRAGRSLDPKARPKPYPHNMSRITTDQAAEIITSLVDALETTRAALRATQAQLRPAQDDLRAAEEADAAVDAALLAAKAKLDAWHAEDAQEADDVVIDAAPEAPEPPSSEEPGEPAGETAGQGDEVTGQEPAEETPGA